MIKKRLSPGAYDQKGCARALLDTLDALGTSRAYEPFAINSEYLMVKKTHIANIELFYAYCPNKF